METTSKIFSLMIGMVICGSQLFAQSIPDSIKEKLDRLFMKWNSANSPGCAIGIVRNDSLIYAKGYGMANLEYDIPNTPATIFPVGSIAKQFTAWSILLLERQGKLHLDDDIRQHLVWLPDLKEKITIRNLLNHTGGMRDHMKLLAIIGTNVMAGDVITQEQAIRILSKQRELNFKPGEKFSYSNSGYSMLSEIVRSVSGLSLRQFTDSAIFRPLGMSNTHFHDDYTEIDNNHAYQYERKNNNNFKNSISNNSLVGSQGLYSNINDMSKWVVNFYEHKTGDQQMIDSLTKKGKLNNGKALLYARGIVVDTYRGWKQYSHDGQDVGARAYATVLPDLKMGFILFSNIGDLNAKAMSNQMAEFFIKDTTQNKKSAGLAYKESTEEIAKDSLSLQKYLGHYFGDDGMPVSFDFKDGKLYYYRTNNSGILVKESKDTFSIMNYPVVKFVFGINAKDTIVDVFENDRVYHLQKYIRDTPGDRVLQSYAGDYYCPELGCTYGIVLKDHQLILTNNKYTDTKLVWIKKDHLISDYWWINHLQMLRDGKNQVIGFEVNSSLFLHSVMHLRFIKTK
jgi:CubicO group peptidase (beta-lactamase class C family)